MDDSPTDMDLSEASSEQAAALDDREVTLDEYQAAFTRYQECLSGAGHELGSVIFDGQEYSYVVSTDAVESGADDECYRTEFSYVDMYWQTSDRLQDASPTTP
ncbi:hypothetical protein [Georgenia satyanarayanai]|nr:hypothetical protein [Georgenia satyanarayanai]